MIVLYDSSFEGFLTLVYKVYYEKITPSKIIKTYPDTLVLEEIVEIKTHSIQAKKVLDALKKEFTRKNFESIFHIFMCDSKEFELHLLHFILLGFKDQKQLSNINYPFIFTIQNLLKEFFRHNHKMTGFVRFIELADTTLYAKVDSKFNVIYFLGKHFLKRFNNQNYIIHDIERKIAFIKNNDFIGVQEVTNFEEPKISDDEQKFSKLWQTFFKSVAIESRKNTNLQRQLVPLLYRTYMNEFCEN